MPPSFLIKRLPYFIEISLSSCLFLIAIYHYTIELAKKHRQNGSFLVFGRSSRPHERSAANCCAVCSRRSLGFSSLFIHILFFGLCLCPLSFQLFLFSSGIFTSYIVNYFQNKTRAGTGLPMDSSFCAGLLISGDGGIRTHVPGLTDNSISSRARYDRFDTSPSV